MTVDSPVAQLESAAARGGPLALFGGIEFDMTESESPGEGGEGEEAEVRFGNAEGPIGAMLVDVLDSGDSDDAGLTVGLRGWRLSEAVASV